MTRQRVFLVFLFLPLIFQKAASFPGGDSCEARSVAPHVSPGTPFHSLSKEFHAGRADAPAGPHWFCLWQYDFDFNAQPAYFWQSLPSSRWALQISPMNYCTVWTAEFHFDLQKNSLPPKQDTLEIQLQEANSPYNLIYKTIFLINPNNVESLYPLYPPLGAPYSTGTPIINTKRNFLLTAKFRGPANDSVRWLFKTPSQHPTSFRFVTNTSLQSASQAVGQSVDLYWGAELCIHIPIPIELAAFRAERGAAGVLLFWETAAEMNNYGFRIQRAPSRDGPWEERGFVPGKGNSATRQYYSFDDPSGADQADAPPEGAAWYRLLQMDYDGTTEEYPPLLVSAADIPEGVALLQNFPNPFGTSSLSGSSATTFQYSLPGETDVELTVSDVFGRRLAILDMGRKSGGIHSIQWMARELPTGTYFARLTAGSVARTSKFILLR